MIQADDLLRSLPVLFCAGMTAILFLQSGLDKVFDWKGNIGWLTGHFEKTPLAGMVPMMLATITVLELTTGLLAAAGIVYLLIAGSAAVIFWSSVAGAAAILALFFGQRIAKDYPGAAILVPYFVLMIVMMVLSRQSLPALAP